MSRWVEITGAYRSLPEGSLQTYRLRIENKCKNKNRGRVILYPAHHGAIVSRCLFSEQALFQGHQGTVHQDLMNARGFAILSSRSCILDISRAKTCTSFSSDPFTQNHQISLSALTRVKMGFLQYPLSSPTVNGSKCQPCC